MPEGYVRDIIGSVVQVINYVGLIQRQFPHLSWPQRRDICAVHGQHVRHDMVLLLQ